LRYSKQGGGDMTALAAAAEYAIGQRVEAQYGAGWVACHISRRSAHTGMVLVTPGHGVELLRHESEVRPLAASQVYAIGQRVESAVAHRAGRVAPVRYDGGATGTRCASDLRPLAAKESPAPGSAWRPGFIADRVLPVAAPEANATCHHCGGPAYHGLHSATCLRATGCGPEPLAQPAHVASVVLGNGERVWRAWSGGDRAPSVTHPLREEAVRLWREAVTAERAANPPITVRNDTPWAPHLEASRVAAGPIVHAPHPMPLGIAAADPARDAREAVDAAVRRDGGRLTDAREPFGHFKAKALWVDSKGRECGLLGTSLADIARAIDACRVERARREAAK
jgi:hypothetical protein